MEKEGASGGLNHPPLTLQLQQSLLVPPLRRFGADL